MELLTRITLNPKACKGRPTIRNMRFTVAQLLDLLASGQIGQKRKPGNGYCLLRVGENHC